MDDIQEQGSVSEQKDVCVDSQRNKSIRNQHAQYYLKKKKKRKKKMESYFYQKISSVFNKFNNRRVMNGEGKRLQ